MNPNGFFDGLTFGLQFGSQIKARKEDRKDRKSERAEEIALRGGERAEDRAERDKDRGLSLNRWLTDRGDRLERDSFDRGLALRDRDTADTRYTTDRGDRLASAEQQIEQQAKSHALQVGMQEFQREQAALRGQLERDMLEMQRGGSEEVEMDPFSSEPLRRTIRRPLGPPAGGAAPGGTPAPSVGAAGPIAPPQQAIEFLMAHPDTAGQFDRMFGAGMAERILGGRR